MLVKKHRKYNLVSPVHPLRTFKKRIQKPGILVSRAHTHSVVVSYKAPMLVTGDRFPNMHNLASSARLSATRKSIFQMLREVFCQQLPQIPIFIKR